MFESLQDLFTSKDSRKSGVLRDQSDLRYVIQEFLQKELQTDAVVCDEVSSGEAQIRVRSSALAQEVMLFTADLKDFLLDTYNYELKNIHTRIG